MSHTPGPFHVEKREHVFAVCCSPTRKGEHPEVAFIERTATSFPGAAKGDLSAGSITAQQRTRRELRANAILFAAAPELLAACRELLDLLYEPGEDATHAIAAAKSAIAKAEFDEPLRCPECGYTQEDADLHGDHGLCTGSIPQL